ALGRGTEPVADRDATSGTAAFVLVNARKPVHRCSHDAGVFVKEVASPAGGSRASRRLRLPAWRGHGHVPLATAAVAAVRMRMTGCQARTNEVAKEVHGPSPQSSAAAPRGTGRNKPSRGVYQPAGRGRRGSVLFLTPPPDASGRRRCD